MKLLLLLLIIITSISCNKNDDNNTPKSTKDLLINKKWQVVAISGVLIDGTIQPDIFSSLPESEKDDYYYFRFNLSYEINENNLKRPTTQFDKFDEGTWKLTDGDKYIELQSTTGIGWVPFEIISLSENELKFLRVQTDGQFEFLLKPMQ